MIVTGVRTRTFVYVRVPAITIPAICSEKEHFLCNRCSCQMVIFVNCSLRGDTALWDEKIAKKSTFGK